MMVIGVSPLTTNTYLTPNEAYCVNKYKLDAPGANDLYNIDAVVTRTDTASDNLRWVFIDMTFDLVV